MIFTRRKFIRLTSNGIILPLMGPIPFFTPSGEYGEITLSGEAQRIHREALVLDDPDQFGAGEVATSGRPLSGRRLGRWFVHERNLEAQASGCS